jgi:hypothetical protein
MNKVSLGKTDEQGKTMPTPDVGAAASGNPALNLANLGKVELHAEVDECVNGKKQVYLVGPGGQLPPPSKDCKRHRLAGSFFWGQAAQVLLDLGLGTVTTAGRPTASQRQAPAKAPAAAKNVPLGANQQPGVPGNQQAIGQNANPASGPKSQTGGTPFPPDLPDLVQRIAVQKWLEDLTKSIPGTYAIDPDVAREHGIRQNKEWLDPNKNIVPLPQVEALALIQYISSKELGKARYAASQELQDLTLGQKAAKIVQLQKASPPILKLYQKFQAQENVLRNYPVGVTLEGIRKHYYTLLSQVATLESQGKDASALKKEMATSDYGRYVTARDNFYQALSKNPFLGTQLSDGAPYLFQLLLQTQNAEELTKLFDQHVTHFVNQLDGQRERIDNMLTVDQLWDLGGPQYAQLRALAAIYGGVAADRLMGMVEANYNGVNAVADYDKALGDFILAIGQAIPGVGLAFTAIQVMKDGTDYVVAIGDEKTARALAPVAGYQGVIQAVEQRDSAGNKFAVSVALTAVQIPEFLNALKTGKNLRIRMAGGTPKRVITQEEVAQAYRQAQAAKNAAARASGESASAVKIGADVPKSVPEQSGWAPGRQPINQQQAEQALRDFIARQDKLGGVQEVEAEIELARKYKVPEEKIKEITKYYKPEGSPLNNKTIATELMKARLQTMGYDVTMTAEEFNTLQGISVRSGQKGAGLTQKDIDFLRSKLAADPKYFEKLPQRGYVTDFLKDKWYEQLRPQEGFIAGLDAESAATIEGAFRWNRATEVSPMLKSFEDAVRNKVPVEQLKDQVMALKADPQAMRSLKNAPNDVKDAFNGAESLVYKQHDEAVVNFVKNTKLDKQGKPAPWSKPGVEVKVDDFRTPGGNSIGVNTDRDYRILYKDPEKGWLEVPKEYWQNYSSEQFAVASGYSPEKLRQIAAPDDIRAWQTWDPAKHHGETVEQAMQERWKELHQQLGTDKYHPEASVEFSDQGIVTGQQAQVKANIKAVKSGDALLKDAEGFGMMYNEKADAYLRLKSAMHPDGDKLEAMAQLNKGIDMLNDVRTGYRKFFADRRAQAPLSALPDNFQKASDAIQTLRPFDKTITPEQVKEVEDTLRSLGFAGGDGKGDPFRGYVKAMDGQFEALKTVQPRGAMNAGNAAAAVPPKASAAGENAAPKTEAVNGTPGPNVGGAAAAGAKAVNTAANTGGSALGTCAAGKKKLNYDQYERMRVLLLMQAQGATPSDPSRYSDLPPVSELDPYEQYLLAQDMAVGASRAKDEGNASLEKVYEGLATKLNWRSDSKTAMNPPQTGVPATSTAAAANTAGTAGAFGKGIRAGDYVAMDGAIYDYIRSNGLNPSGWAMKRNPGGSVTYTSPDGKTAFTASFSNGQISIQPAAANAAGGGAPAGEAGPAVNGGANTSGGAPAVTPQALCAEAEHECAAAQEAYNAAVEAYNQTMRDLRDAVSQVEATGPELSAAGAAFSGLKPTDPGYAEAQGRLVKAQADDQAAVDQQTKWLQAKEAANTKFLLAEENLKKCLDAAEAKCRKPAAAQQPAQTDGQNAIGGGIAPGVKAGIPGGVNAGGQLNGANTVGGGSPEGTNPPGTGGATPTLPGGAGSATGPNGGNVIGRGATLGAAKTCKHSDEECADLGRIAAEKQLEALHARDDVRRAYLLVAQADLLDSQATYAYQNADTALEDARLAQNRGDSAAAAAFTAQFRAYQAQGAARRTEAAAVRERANGAEARATAAETAAADAWKQYNDCLRRPPCPEDSNASPTGGNVIGGGTPGSVVNVAGGPGTGSPSFSNCPKAQEQLDEAKYWHMQAALDMAKMQQAIMAGDSRAAQYLQNSVALDESFAQNHERMAAYELAECNKKMMAAKPAGPTPNATTPGAAAQPTPTPAANSVGASNPAASPSATVGASNSQPAKPASGTATTPPMQPANSAGEKANNTNPSGATNTGGADTSPSNASGMVAPPPEGTSSACMPGNDACTNPVQCTTDPSCMNIKDVCKISPNACSNNTSGDSPYQLMMTASAIVPPKTSRLERTSQFVPAAYHHPRRALDPLPTETLLAEMPAQEDKGKSLDVSLVATGNSSGEAFQLQMRDPSGKTKRVAMPEGVVLEPVKPGSTKPPAASGMSGLLTQQVGGFCVQFLKLPPELGMVYKIAGPELQQKFGPMRLVLQAGRALAEKGKLHPDSDPSAYADSIRQYAVWAQQESWDEKKFGDNFVGRTRKNAEVKKIKWSQQIEAALRGAVPGRWRDITQVLNLAQAWRSTQTHGANANN